MNREQAITIVLAEAFSETGLAVLAENGEDPGWERINNLIGALAFLIDELADEDSFGREFVSALFVLGNHVPDLLRRRHPEGPHFRPSLYEQANDLNVAVTALIENWNNWPDWETHELRTFQFEMLSEKSAAILQPERVGGYSVGDITYCLIPDTLDCFPVRVDRLGNGYLDVEPWAEGTSACAEFVEEAANRRFFLPTLSPGARFGGDDERLVNSERKSGPELRLLPVDYETKTLSLIRERHAIDPIRWPLPTGLIFERWFQDRNARRE
jgi:hypothetical protein